MVLLSPLVRGTVARAAAAAANTPVVVVVVVVVCVCMVFGDKSYLFFNI